MDHVEITKQLFIELFTAFKNAEYGSEDKAYFYNQVCAIHTLLLRFNLSVDEIAELKNTKL